MLPSLLLPRLRFGEFEESTELIVVSECYEESRRSRHESLAPHCSRQSMKIYNDHTPAFLLIYYFRYFYRVV